jgi:serpin B
MKRIVSLIVLAGFGAACLYLAGPEIPFVGAMIARAPSPYRAEVATSQAALAWKLLAVREKSPQSLVSPASLASAVATADLGASPVMKAALMKAVAFDALPMETAEQRLADARDALADAPSSTFVSADLFVHPSNRPLSYAMAARLAARGVGEKSLDLDGQDGIDAVNAWVKKATRGEIDGILEHPLPDEAAVILNALFFKAKWKDPFEKSSTREAPFHDAGGGRGQVMMMYRRGQMLGRKAPGFVAAEIPFRGDRYAMTVLTTNEKPAPLQAFAPMVGWLSGEGFVVQDVALEMPRFRLEDSGSLLAALKGDLEPANQTPAPFVDFNPNLQLGDIVQRVKVEVDEEGAKAAAVTAMQFSEVSAELDPPKPLYVILDKPFLFALRDRDSGLILVAGYVGQAPKD